MTAYHSCIGYPWILNVLAKYDGRIAKQKPVPAQVVKFVKMPDLSSEDCEYEAAVHISDQKYYIKAFFTKEAHETLEREDDHFTMGDIKSKIIILKKFTVCFREAEDLACCEFYLHVLHFSVLAMETNVVDVMNCNQESSVKKKIKELWQNYITALEMKETSCDTSLSDISLTQLLMVASEEKLCALKSLAEQCLDLNPCVNQEIPPQARTRWSIERKSMKRSADNVSIPINILLMPPHEEAALEQMTDIQPSASTCVAWQSAEKELRADPNSSTPDILPSQQDISMDVSYETRNQISPVIFFDHPINLQTLELESVHRGKRMDNSNSSSALVCTQRTLQDTSLYTLGLVPLGQDCLLSPSPLHSPTKSSSLCNNVQISPTVPFSTENENSPCRIKRHVSVSNGINKDMGYLVKSTKPVKRKQASEDPETTLSDQEDLVPASVERLVRVMNVPAGSTNNRMYKTDNERRSAVDMQKSSTLIESNTEQEKLKQVITTGYVEASKAYPKSTVNRAKRHNPVQKPCLEFVVKPKIVTTKNLQKDAPSAETPKTSRTSFNKASGSRRTLTYPATEANTAPVTELIRTGMIHHDGTPFQYKYKTPYIDLCGHVNSIRVPTDLCDWAVKILSEHMDKHHEFTS